MIQRVLPYFLLVCFVSIGAAVLWPVSSGSPYNARRANCQSNLKQIGLAFQQYTQDNGDRLPLRHWSVPITAYLKSNVVFQCPETPAKMGTSDYFFNAHFLKKWLGDIEEPSGSILMGEGLDDASPDTTLSQLPDVWRKDEKSPLWRHLEGANYGFGDGHVKWMKANKVSRDVEVVKP